MSSGTARGGVGSRPLVARSALSSLMLLSSALGACAGDRPDFAIVGDAGATAGGGSNGGAAGAMAAAGLGGSIPGLMIPSPVLPCQVPESGAAVFKDRAVTNEAPARRELYTWTTSEQAREIRAGSVLLTRTEREGLGPGYALETLAQLGTTTSTDPTLAQISALAALLSGPDFAKARYAWSEPWATRVGWPGETYGDQLVRIVLRPEAWLARFRDGRLDVVDMDNVPVPLAEALAHPERLAGFYFVRDDGAGGPRCNGSFRQGDNGYREFVIGNEAMIEQWSIGTSQIRERLEQDIALLQAFFDRIRICPNRGDASSFNLDVVCSWADPPLAEYSELRAYHLSLAIPSAGYMPAPVPLATLLEALEGSLFEPDPFVVEPTR